MIFQQSNLVKENNDLASVLTNLPVRGSIEEISLDENSDAECEENQNAEEVETNLNGASTSTGSFFKLFNFQYSFYLDLIFIFMISKIFLI